MFSFQSAESPAICALARSRSTRARSAAISSGLVACSVSQLFLSQSRKLTFVPNEEDFFTLQHAIEKMMFRRQLGAVLCGWIDRRVDLAPQHLLGAAERLGRLGERYLSDDHDIDIACVPLLAPGNGAVDEGRAYARGKRRQRGTQCVGNPSGLDDKSFHLRIYGAVRVGLEIYLPPLYRSAHNAGAGEKRELSLHCAAAERC